MHNEICVSVRDQAGNTLPLQQVSIWSDVGGSTAATLYASASATTPTDNPTTTDGNGLLHVWTLEDELWYTTPLQGTPLRLPVLHRYENEEINVKDFGAMGDGVADDTAAFVAAIAAQRAISEANYGLYGMNVMCPAIRIPQGTYVVHTGELVIDYRNARIFGDGRENSVLMAPDGYDDGAMIELNGGVPFDADGFTGAENTWQGSRSQGWEFKDFSIIAIMADQWTRLTPRTGIGIYDVGVGNGTTWNIEIRGFEYGFASPYGHDFGYHYNLFLFWNDYNLYLGPGSEQCYFYGLNTGIGIENIVLEGVRNIGFYGVNITNSQISDIVLTGGALTTPTRMGATRPAKDACYAVSFHDVWHECSFSADFVTGWNELFDTQQFVSFEGDGWSHRNIVFFNSHISRVQLTGQDETDKSVIRMNDQTACAIYFITPHFIGMAGFECIVIGDPNPSYGVLVIERPLFESYVWPDDVDYWWKGASTTGVPLGFKVQGDGGVMSTMTDSAGQTSLEQPYMCRITKFGTGGSGWEIGTGMTTPAGIGFGWSNDYGANMTRGAAIDPLNSHLYLGDIEADTACKICFMDAEPTSGHWHVGDIIFHKDAAPSGYVGWICTTGGTGGAGAVFKTFGAISA